MKTILVPVDFSEATTATVATAVSWARACNGKIVLLHVVTPPLENLTYPTSDNNAWERATTLARRDLNQISVSLQAEKIEVSVRTIGGFPVETILAQARECQADVIVMGSHGHAAFYDLLVGSTSSGVLKGASCPVMLTPVAKGSVAAKPAEVM